MSLYAKKRRVSVKEKEKAKEFGAKTIDQTKSLNSFMDLTINISRLTMQQNVYSLKASINYLKYLQFVFFHSQLLMLTHSY